MNQEAFDFADPKDEEAEGSTEASLESMSDEELAVMYKKLVRISAKPGFARERLIEAITAPEEERSKLFMEEAEENRSDLELPYQSKK